MGVKDLARYGARVGYTETQMKLLGPADPRRRHIERLAQAASRYSIQAEVVQARNCSSGYRVGDKFILNIDGNFITKLCPKKLCIYAMSQLTIPVALISERLGEGLDPNHFHMMHYVRCPDTGVECSGYGEVMLGLSVIPR